MCWHDDDAVYSMERSPNFSCFVTLVSTENVVEGHPRARQGAKGGGRGNRTLYPGTSQRPLDKNRAVFSSMLGSAAQTSSYNPS